MGTSQAPTTLTISALIPTLGRQAEVIETVRALLTQTRPPDEIIVVDQNMPEFQELSRFLKSDPRIRHIRSDTPGYSINLNRALQAARSDVVLFLDDDVRLKPDLVERHLRNFSERSQGRPLGCVAGRVHQPQGDLTPSSIQEVGVYKPLTGEVIGNFNADRAHECDVAPGGNMSLRKEVLVRAGGFDEGFDGNGYRCETDACLRVKALGFRVLFDPTAELDHLMAPAGGCRTRSKAEHTYYFVKSGIRLYRRHSPRLGLPAFAARMTAYVSAKSAYNRDPEILKLGLRGVYDGLTQSMNLRSPMQSGR